MVQQTAVYQLFIKWVRRDLEEADFDQAEETEKEQIDNAYDAGLFDGSMDDVKDRMYKDYYNQTYNK